MVGILMCMAVLGTEMQVQPDGEWRDRIELVQQRMLRGTIPSFTDDFILADVALRPDYPRRFTNYSGDLSGRYIGAFACMPAHGARLDDIVTKTLTFQKADGRFGSESLKYLPSEMGLEHMALLWGNGRLLVGLLEYHHAHPSAEVLEASRRLGDFLLSVHEACANEVAAARVRDLGAGGMICFTQLIEGLVMLSEATGDQRYLAGAEAILPWFEKEPGTQHSHGYFTTLRGMVMLYEATKKPELLGLVEQLYSNFRTSPAHLVYGGVMEFFDGRGDRDEGCSEADFVRLGLQLWRATGQSRYLDDAEICLFNQFLGNQFATGDFGHHLYVGRGVAPYAGEGRAWWCCTMHGLRAFRDIVDAAITHDKGVLRVNLVTDLQWSGETGEAQLRTRTTDAQSVGAVLLVRRAPESGLRVAFRCAPWMVEPRLSVNGAITTAREEGGYLAIDKALQEGTEVALNYGLRLTLVRRDGTTFPPEALSDTPVTAALFRGPWLVGVNSRHEPMFFGEPWEENEVKLTTEPGSGTATGASFEIPAAHVQCAYTHSGFPGEHPLTLTPMSERTRQEASAFAAWLNYRSAR